MDRMRLSDADWEDLFEGVRMIEAGALESIHPPKDPAPPVAEEG